jgi:hypothetical protein
MCSVFDEVAWYYVIAGGAELSCVWYFSETLKARTDVDWMAQLLGERFPRRVFPLLND